MKEFLRDNYLNRNVMPTDKLLMESGRHDLASAIIKFHGGIISVAKALDLDCSDSIAPQAPK